ncbi:TnpV protein [Clostridiaceae bacterium 35-E11]
MKKNKLYLFSMLLWEGELMKHLIEIEKKTYERFERIQKEYIREHPLSNDENFMESYRIRREACDMAKVFIKNLEVASM